MRKAPVLYLFAQEQEQYLKQQDKLARIKRRENAEEKKVYNKQVKH